MRNLVPACRLIVSALILWGVVAIQCSAQDFESQLPEAVSALTPRPVQYTSDVGAKLLLYAWSGEQVTLLTMDPDRDPLVMAALASKLDAAFDYYSRITRRRPEVLKTVSPGLDPIATVPHLQCDGAACGEVGRTGIELRASTFSLLYTGVRDHNEFDQVPFYEFGRNFWFYGPQIEYHAPDDTMVVDTGYAVFMRFMAMDAAHVTPGPFQGTVPFGYFRSSVESLVDLYEADLSLTWENTLRIGKAPETPLKLGGTDLFSSFLMRLTRAFGLRFVDQLWAEVGTRPAATTTQDAVDNLVLAASAAAGSNLTDVFGDRWRWPVSATARMEAKVRFGNPIKLLPG